MTLQGEASRSLEHYRHEIRNHTYQTARQSSNLYVQNLFSNRIGVIRKLCWLKARLENITTKPKTLKQLCQLIQKELGLNQRASLDYSHALLQLGLYRFPTPEGQLPEEDIQTWINKQYGK